MTENIFTTHTEPQTDPPGDPTLRRNLELPKGVLQKNLKIFVYLGAALLVIVAALFSSSGKKATVQQAGSKGQPPQPTLQDNTDSNVQELILQLLHVVIGVVLQGGLRWLPFGGGLLCRRLFSGGAEECRHNHEQCRTQINEGLEVLLQDTFW